MSHLAGLKVLVIEDEAVIAFDMCDHLRDVGITPLGPMLTFDAALEFVLNQPPFSAALLDISLRGRDSWAIADALRERNIPFIYVTARLKRDLPERHRDAPMVSKPFIMEELVAELGIIARS